MRKAFLNLVLALVSVTVLSFAAVLAVGNFSWQPADQAAAIQTVSNYGSVSAVASQQVSPATSVEPSQEILAGLYQTISPSVVNIAVTTNSTASQGFGTQAVPQQGQGSGWIWDNQGHIVTNNHVVEDAAEVTVFFSNGMWAEAEVIAADPQADLAVIKVTPPAGVTWQPLSLAADVPLVGYSVVAFGSPFGLVGSMTQGIISAVGRSFPVSDAATGAQYSLPEVIQTDAAINPGNSGGPLLNLSGEVIGVNFAIRSEARSNSGVGFAIPVTVVRRVVPALIDEGFFRYPYLGISGGSLTPASVRQLNLPDNTLGVLVVRVVGGPASAAGLRDGDIITAIDGRSVRSFEDLIGYLLTDTSAGQTVQLTVQRDGSTLTLPLTLGERPRQNTNSQGG